MFQIAQSEYDPYILNARILLLIVLFYVTWFCIPLIFHLGIQVDIVYLQFTSFIMPLFATGLMIFLVYVRLAKQVPIHWWIIVLSLVLGIALSWYSYNRLYDIVEKI